MTGAAGQDQVVALQPGPGDLIGAYLASRKAWLGSESPDAALFIDASAQPMTSSKVQYLIQRLYERSGLDGQVPEGAAVQALHATFVAEALAHWTEVLREALAPPPPGISLGTGGGGFGRSAASVGLARAMPWEMR